MYLFIISCNLRYVFLNLFINKDYYNIINALFQNFKIFNYLIATRRNRLPERNLPANQKTKALQLHLASELPYYAFKAKKFVNRGEPLASYKMPSNSNKNLVILPQQKT